MKILLVKFPYRIENNFYVAMKVKFSFNDAFGFNQY